MYMYLRYSILTIKAITFSMYNSATFCKLIKDIAQQTVDMQMRSVNTIDLLHYSSSAWFTRQVDIQYRLGRAMRLGP